MGLMVSRGGMFSGGAAVVDTAFRTRWKTDNSGVSTSTQILIPTAGFTTYNCTINGVAKTNSDIVTVGGRNGFLLDFGTAGTYDVAIEGTFPRILNLDSGDKLKLVSVENWGNIAWASMESAFYGCSNMVFNASDVPDTSAGINFFAAWAGCSSLTSFPAIDTANGTTFQAAWLNCSGLTSFPAIDTANGTIFQDAWRGCNKLTSFPAIDTAKGTSFLRAWLNCSGLTSFPSLDTANGTTFQQAWEGCSGLTSFPAIDTAKGTTFQQAWSGCSGLTSFPAIDTAKGTTFQSAWSGCSGLTSFPSIDTSEGTNFQTAWLACSGLTSFPSIDTAKGTNFISAWNGCGTFTSFPLLNFRIMNNGTNCFINSTLPTASWSNILVDIANNGTVNTVSFHGGSSKYNTDGATARTTLTTPVIDGGRGWSITDGGAA
jgi:hypothetical protein